MGSGGGGGGCTGCFRVTTRNSRPVLYPYSSGVLELSPGGGRVVNAPGRGSQSQSTKTRGAPGVDAREPRRSARRAGGRAGEARRTRTLGRARAVRDRVIREGVRGVSDLRIRIRPGAALPCSVRVRGSPNFGSRIAYFSFLRFGMYKHPIPKPNQSRVAQHRRRERVAEGFREICRVEANGATAGG